jgi:ABC-type sugar transport system ATPase subunit
MTTSTAVATSTGAAPLLALRGIDKSFPGVRALSGVDLELHAGEILALCGENGAGKSTLIKVMTGVHAPDAGTIAIDGRAVRFEGPAAARRAGLAVIHQELSLVPSLSARENICLGREVTRAGFVRPGEERKRTAELLARVGVSLDPEVPARALTIAQQQAVEIAKALGQDARILVLDEPSATLTPPEVERLFVVLRELKAGGVGLVYVSHRLEEVFALADRIMVMRDGRHVSTRRAGEVTRLELIETMAGRPLTDEFPRRQVAIGGERLVVSGLTRGTSVRDVSFVIRRGEVLGLAGLVGAGRTEVARLLFGADRPDSGTIALDGRTLELLRPRDAIREGICLLPEDRKAQGLVLLRSVLENFGLPSLRHFTRRGLLDRRRERDAFARWVEAIRIRVAAPEQKVRELSGGNQQKVVLARWLERNCEVVLFDEPTRGIDVGAKYEIYTLINELAAQGKAILLVSSELPELLGLSDRVFVMHEGRVTGEIAEPSRATPERILELAMG